MCAALKFGYFRARLCLGDDLVWPWQPELPTKTRSHPRIPLLPNSPFPCCCRFKVFADYEAYVKCQEKVSELYLVSASRGTSPETCLPIPGKGSGTVGRWGRPRRPGPRGCHLPSPCLLPELQGVDQNGDQEHRGGGQVLQRPHHQGVRPGHLARGALRPENPPTQRAQGGGRGRDPQRDGGAGVAGVPGGRCCCCCCCGSFIGKSKTVLPCCLR